MDTKQIQYFLTLAQYRNYTQASKHLYLSQSALSRQIIALEEELGVSLFRRTSRAVELTTAGEIFQSESEKLLRNIEDITSMVREADRGASGYLKIGSIGSINHQVTRIINEFHKTYSSVYIGIENYNTTDLTEALACGELDLAFTFLFSVKEYESLEYRELCSEEFYVLVSKDSPYASMETLNVEDIRKERIILPNFTHPPFIEELFISERDISITYTRSIDALLLHVESGLGISLVPAFVIAGRESHHNILMKKIDGYELSARVVLSWRKDNENPAIIPCIALAGEISQRSRSNQFC